MWEEYTREGCSAEGAVISHGGASCTVVLRELQRMQDRVVCRYALLFHIISFCKRSRSLLYNALCPMGHGPVGGHMTMCSMSFDVVSPITFPKGEEKHLFSTLMTQSMSVCPTTSDSAFDRKKQRRLIVQRTFLRFSLMEKYSIAAAAVLLA